MSISSMIVEPLKLIFGFDAKLLIRYTCMMNVTGMIMNIHIPDMDGHRYGREKKNIS